MKFKETYTLNDQEMLQAVLNYLNFKGMLRATSNDKVCHIGIRGNVMRENYFEITYTVTDAPTIKKELKDAPIIQKEEVKVETEEKKEGRFLRPEKEDN